MVHKLLLVLMKIISTGLASIRSIGPVLTLSIAMANPVSADRVSLVPQPVMLAMRPGKFVFTAGMTILAAPVLQEQARLFARSLAPAVGFTPEVRASGIGSAPHVENEVGSFN
jgi:hypothetical protein